MGKVTLQIQSVIYKNEVTSLYKAMEGIDAAIANCRNRGIEIEAVLHYGDASPEPIIKDADIQRINQKYTYIQFKYSYFACNTGTAKGHNNLAYGCSTDYMMIMNPDIIMEAACIYELLMMLENEEVGMVEARQTPLELAKVYDIKTFETEWVSTACTVFKTEIFHKLKGFDYETFFMYCDDLDFSWRLRLEGYQIKYNPNAIIYHSKKLSNIGQWRPTSAEVYYSAEAAILMAYKWSNDKRVEKLLAQYDSVGGEDEQRAANEFRKRKRERRLPLQLDKEHKIAKFIGDNYSLMRFSYNK